MFNSQETSPEINSVVTPPTAVTDLPQFATAEYAHIPGSERCRICSNLISGDYFRINNQMACANCAQQALSGQPADSHAAFARGLLLGIGGAVLGLILYAGFAIATGWTIGYVALAVGWLVGKGMIKGSNGLGGRRYQIAAVILTYAAISLSAIPIAIGDYLKNPEASAGKSQNGAASAENSGNQSSSAPKSSSSENFGALAGRLLLMGLASPFLEFSASPASAALGLFILFIGLRIAWTLTQARALAVEGPYSATAP
jgi:hypothetical protein